MSKQKPTPEPEPPPGWQKLTPETVFEAGEYYVLLTRMHEPFVAQWYPGRCGGLIPLGRGDGEFSGRDELNFPALYYVKLPPIPDGMLDQICGMVASYVRDARSGRLEVEVLRLAAELDAEDAEGGEP